MVVQGSGGGPAKGPLAAGRAPRMPRAAHQRPCLSSGEKAIWER